MGNARTRLLYVADPMCSWCWGFAPVIARAEEFLRDDVPLTLVLGGLAPDSDVPMEDSMRSYVQQAWRSVEATTGARFDHSFWKLHHPRRSTWPACRAVLAAGERGREMFAAIQRAYYQEARDPSDPATLVELGVELGFDREAFTRDLDAPATHERLAADFALRDALGATGYPSVGIEDDGELRLLTRGWAEWPVLRAALAKYGA